MKKVLVFALVLSLVLGSFAFAFAADFDDTIGEPCEAAVNVLTDLGVVSGYPDGTYKPEGIVTRAEMAKLIIVALGLEDYVEGAYAAFADVPGSHWATSFIAYAASMGIIEGYPDGTFRPDATVTYQEAATMIVRALGYQDQYLTGVWPASHVSMAMNLGILDGIKATADGANRGDIAIMLYQTLACATVSYDSSGSLVRGKTMLSRLGATAVNEDEYGVPMPVVITKKMANDAVIDIEEYIGAYASVYVNKDDEIIVLAEVKSEFLTGDLDYEDMEFELADGTVYKLDNRAKEAIPAFKHKVYYGTEQTIGGNKVIGYYNTEPDAVDFYNGAQAAAMTQKTTSPAAAGFVFDNWTDTIAAADDLDAFTIAAKVSGNYITDIYSVALWDSNNEVQWTADFAEELEEDLTVDDWEFALTNKDEIDLDSFVLEGVDSLDAIAVDNVVTVYADVNDKTNGEITKVEVGTEVVTGKITKYNSVDGEYTIDGTVYVESAHFDGTLDLGDEGDFYLNYQGEIAFFDASDYAGNYALALGKVYNSTSATGSTNELWMLNKDGTDTVYKFSPNSVAASAPFTGITTPAAAQTWANVTGRTLIEIDVNSSGKITDGTDANLQPATKLSANGLMNNKVVSDDVVVFLAYDESSSDWSIGTLADVLVGETFAANSVYYATNNDDKIDAIVIAKDSGLSKESEFGFFTSWNKSYNADEDPIFSGKILIDGALADYVTYDNAQALEDAVKDYVTLYKLTYSGDAIKSVDKATTTNVSKSGILMEDFNGKFGLVFENTTTTSAGITSAAVWAGDSFYKVVAKDGDRINVGGLATADIDFQPIAGAVAYKVVLNDASNDIKKLAEGKLSDVKKGAWVMLLQLDKDSDAWDTVIYVTGDDAEKLSGFVW